MLLKERQLDEVDKKNIYIGFQHLVLKSTTRTEGVKDANITPRDEQFTFSAIEGLQ